MVSHFKLMLALAALSSFGFVQAQGTGGAESSGDDLTTLPSLPYIAEVIGNDVYVRSGGGTAFYYTSKVNFPTRVTVVGHLHGWSEIIPPVGSFSWVSKEYIQRPASSPGVGIIKGDGVRVWAGSDYVEPMRSFQLQVKLNDGDMVRLIDADNQKGDYYKIVPPSGAHLWVSSRYLKYLQPLPKPMLSFVPEPTQKVEPRIEPRVEPRATAAIDPATAGPVLTVDPTRTQPTTIDPRAAEVAPVTVEPQAPVRVADAEAKRVKECYDLAEQIRAELEKPLPAQNYDEYKNALTVILNDPAAGKGQRYAEYQLGQIQRFEVAQQASEEVKKQDAELQKLRQQIRENFNLKIAEIPNPGKYIIKGTLQPSLVFTGEIGKKRYRILNDDGKILCYAVLADNVISVHPDRFVGRKVGLRGSIVSDKINPIGLVTFVAIEELPATETANSK
ncbi:MAG: hypothetical protein IH624_16525 [Phycisphaerae bacterium]|nr:hypothetical protein [Phycisphaerae bacterium]